MTAFVLNLSEADGITEKKTCKWGMIHPGDA